MAVNTFRFENGEEIFRNKLLFENYAVRSINSRLASQNTLFLFLSWTGCRVKSIMITRQNKGEKKDNGYC